MINSIWIEWDRNIQKYPQDTATPPPPAPTRGQRYIGKILSKANKSTLYQYQYFDFCEFIGDF